MKLLLNILFVLLLIHQAKGQCLTGKVLWDSIVVLRGSDVADSIQLRQMQFFLSKARACGYDTDSVYVLLLQRTGALFSYQSDLQEAISHTWQAVKWYDRFASQLVLSPALQIKNYFNLYLYYDESGDERSVLKVVDSCIVLSVRSGYADNYTLDAIDRKSSTQLEAGDYHGSIKTAQLADFLTRKKAGKLSQDERDKLIVILSTRLNALIFLQRYTEAEQLLESRKSEYVQVKNGLHLGNWYALLGKLKRRQNRFEETIQLLQRSVYTHLKSGYKAGAAESLNNIGFVYLDNLHDYQKALPYFHQALKYASKVESLNIYANIANTYVKLKDFKNAFLFFQHAFDQVGAGMNEVKLLASGDSFIRENYAEYLLRLEIYKGDAYLAFYQETRDQHALDNSIAVYKCADQLLNKMKSLQSDFQSKLFWRSDARQLYEHGIEAARLASNHAVALYFFEKSRAVLLSDQIQFRKLLSKDEFAQYSMFKSLITRLESAQTSNPEDEREKKLFTYRLHLGEIEKIIRERRLINDQAVVSIPEIHNKILDDHYLFLQTYCGDSGVYVLAITKETSVLKRISRENYDTLIKMYTGYLADPASLNRNFKHFTEVASRLYSLMFMSLKLQPGRIVVSLDGIPFPLESLVVPGKGTDVQYLIENHPISYTYNARYFIDGTPDKSEREAARLSAFAPVNYSFDRRLQPLNGSNRSIDLIGNYFNRCDKFSLTDASRASFIANYSSSDVILLYTHGAYKSDRDEPVLFFSDSALYLSELAGEQKPRTRLVVLAACESALGSNYEGEGVFSFSRGFASIGIPCSITTLWAVNKESTFAITERFYKYLSQGDPADISLQKAKVELIKNPTGTISLPYYWAGPVLIGNNVGFVTQKTSNPFWLVIIAIALGLLTFFTIRWLKK